MRLALLTTSVPLVKLALFPRQMDLAVSLVLLPDSPTVLSAPLGLSALSALVLMFPVKMVLLADSAQPRSLSALLVLLGITVLLAAIIRSLAKLAYNVKPALKLDSLIATRVLPGTIVLPAVLAVVSSHTQLLVYVLPAVSS